MVQDGQCPGGDIQMQPTPLPESRPSFLCHFLSRRHQKKVLRKREGHILVIRVQCLSLL